MTETLALPARPTLASTAQEIIDYNLAAWNAGEPILTLTTGLREVTSQARHITPETARLMIKMLGHDQAIKAKLHVDPAAAQGGDILKPVEWGLMYRELPQNKGGLGVGYYGLTDLGILFVRGERTVPELAYIRSGYPTRFDGRQIAITDILDAAEYAQLRENAEAAWAARTAL